MKKFCLLSLISVLLIMQINFAGFAEEAEEEKFAPTVTSGGIIINEDGHNTLCGAISDPSWKNTSTTGRPIKYDLRDKNAVLEGIKQTMHNYANTQVTDVVIPTNYQYSFSESEVMEDVADKWNATQTWSSVLNGETIDFSKTMVDVFYTVIYEHGIDVYREWFTQLERDNINGWISIRMNDIHDYKNLKGERNSLFNYTAYENGLTVGSHLGGDYHGFYGCLDYSKDQVYNRYIDYIEEQVNRYGDIIDGIELDYQREANCFGAGDEEDGRTIMTGFLREVRMIVNKVAQEQGHEIQVSVRVPRDLTQCYDSGFDVLTWAKEGLIDTVTVTTRGTCDADMPIASWVKIFDDYGVTINAGTEVLYRSAGGKDYARETNLENDYALAAQYLSEGADKMYYFNHYTTWMEGNNQPFDSSSALHLGTRQELLENAGSLETLADKNKAYLVSFQDKTGNFYDETYLYDPLPITTKAGEVSENLRIKTGSAPEGAEVAVLVGFTRSDGSESAGSDISLTVNGEECTYAEEVLCYEGFKDEEYYNKFFYDMNGSRWFKEYPPKYRIGPNTNVTRAYAYSVSIDSFDEMEQILKFHNNSDTDIDIIYVELRVMPQQNTENHLYKECIDYESCRQIAAGMRPIVGEIRAVAKLYTSHQYGGTEYLQYDIEALSSGVYEVVLCANPAVSPFTISMSSEYHEPTEYELTGEGYLKHSLGEMVLMKGRNTLTMQAVSEGTIYLDYLEFNKVRDIAEEDTKEYVTIPFDSINTSESNNAYYKGSTGMSLYPNAKVVFDFTTQYDGVYDVGAYFKDNGNGRIIYLDIDGVPYAKTITSTDEKFTDGNHIYYMSDFGTVALKAGTHRLIMQRDDPSGSGTIDFRKIELSRVGSYSDNYTGISLTDKDFISDAYKTLTVTAPKAGYYGVSFVYSMADGDEGTVTGSAQVTVGNSSADLVMPSTAGNMTIGNNLGMIYLSKGENTLVVHNKGEYTFKVNKISLNYAKPIEIPLYSFDSEYSSYNKDSSEPAYIVMTSWQDHELTYPMHIAEDGIYKLCVNSVNTYRNYGYDVSVDDTQKASSGELAYIPNGTWIQGTDHFIADLNLKAGDHTLVLTPTIAESNLFAVTLYEVSE